MLFIRNKTPIKTLNAWKSARRSFLLSKRAQVLGQTRLRPRPLLVLLVEVTCHVTNGTPNPHPWLYTHVGRWSLVLLAVSSAQLYAPYCPKQGLPFFLMLSIKLTL